MKTTLLKDLLLTYGKDKLNTFTKYPSILTLHNLGEKGALLDTFTTPIQDEEMFGSEKIDGTNSRILIMGNEHIIGSRENLLHYKDEMFYGTDIGIVDGLKELFKDDFGMYMSRDFPLCVLYGEFYGGKVHQQSKQYGTSKVGFRLFDVAYYSKADMMMLDFEREDISRWRERETPEGLVYGQNFLPTKQAREEFAEYDFVPEVPFDLGDMSHETIYANMLKAIPETLVSLTDSALKKPEGLVLRNKDRSKIVKIRFEDYERTLKRKGIDLKQFVKYDTTNYKFKDSVVESKTIKVHPKQTSSLSKELDNGKNILFSKKDFYVEPPDTIHCNRGNFIKVAEIIENENNFNLFNPETKNHEVFAIKGNEEIGRAHI